MKRTEEYRVRKRDGRIEWLRATKLARSLGQALAAVRGTATDPETGGPLGEDWRSVDLAAAILTGLRSRSGERLLDTGAIAEAAVRVLLATGFPAAAAEYARVGGEQGRRRLALSRSTPPVPPAGCLWSARLRGGVQHVLPAVPAPRRGPGGSPSDHGRV